MVCAHIEGKHSGRRTGAEHLSRNANARSIVGLGYTVGWEMEGDSV